MGVHELDPKELAPMPGEALEVVAERVLAPRAVSAIAEVLEIEVRPAHLEILAEDEDEVVRLAAKRAIRCIRAFGDPDSEVMQRVGEQGLYDYVEAVVDHGAAEKTYLDLMATHHLTPAEATGLYSLRQRVAEETNGQTLGFPSLLGHLELIHISPWEAACDPDAAIAALEEAGLISDHIGGRKFSTSILSVLAVEVSLRPDMDTPKDTEPLEWVRDRFHRPAMWDGYEEE